MEVSQEKMGEPELDLIEKLDEVLSASNSMQSAMQMALDLICIGMKRPSGGLILPPNSRQENIIKIWRQADPAWCKEDGSLAAQVTGLINEVMATGRAKELAGSSGNTIGVAITNHRTPIGVLLLNGGAVSAVERDHLEVIMRLLGRRIRGYQANTATIGREQLLSILRTTSSAQSSNQNFDAVKTKLTASLVNAAKAQGMILILQVGQADDKASRQVFLKKLGWQEASSIQFTSGLLKGCLEQGELTQWSKIDEQMGVNPSIDLIQGTQNHSLVGVPLLVSGEKIGVLGIVDSVLFPLDEVDQSLLTTVTGTLANAFNNELNLEKLKSTNDELVSKRIDAANSRSALRVLFESIPFSFYIINQDFRIVAVNTVRAQQAEAAIPQLVGKVCYEGLFRSQKICPGCLVSTTLETGTNSSREKRTWLKNDTPSDWEINCYPIKDGNGNTVQAILVEQEVTERRRLEAELIQSDKLVATGQLAAGVAHEINNPLAAIIANAQMLMQDIPPENQDMIEAVKLIELAGLRASHVVKNLLGLARKEEYDFKPVDLNESIQDALSLLSHEFVARPIAIRYERGLNLPPITASREHLESIWINLIMNSIEAINDESGAIEINTFYDEGNFYVLIKDTGAGIPEEQLGRIFEPFYTTKSHHRGTGLGLSVVKRIVKAHSGSIQVDSELGKGTTFTVILPEKPATLIEEEDSEG